jgi:dihydroorotase
VLGGLINKFPELKVVFEHVTTKDACDFVVSSSNNVAATITPHHLLANRNDMLAGGIRPHYYCLPVLKRSKPHQSALLGAATSGSPKFFLGTDSAPHLKEYKESSCGCAGVLNAHCAIELYATAFESAGALDRLEGFASKFGPDFYSMPRNQGTTTLQRKEWTVPDSYPCGKSSIVPFMAGEVLRWKVV